MTHRHCFTCRHAVHLTLVERQVLEPQLKEHGLAGPFYGACIYQQPHTPLVVNRYLNKRIDDCSYWSEGFYWEPAGAPCPQCEQGSLVVQRTWNDGQGHIHIVCSRYPDCSYYAPGVYVADSCPSCDGPLVLTADDQLICYCERCQQWMPVLVTLASRPFLLNLRGRCLHGLTYGTCRACAQSKVEHLSGVEQQLERSAQRTMYLMLQEERAEAELERVRFQRAERERAEAEQKRHNTAYFDQENDIIWIPPSEEDDTVDFDLEESFQLLVEEHAEYCANWARSDDEGWFYTDENIEEYSPHGMRG